jgi:hypothetical protein
MAVGGISAVRCNYPPDFVDLAFDSRETGGLSAEQNAEVDFIYVRAANFGGRSFAST